MAFRQRKNPSTIPRTAPAFEHIVTEASDSFLWRLDDYPWERNVWNFHPEYEIHLLRKSSGVVLVGDHIGEFGPGYLTIVGGGLPHDWVTAVQPGELIEGRDIVLQFDAQRLRGSAVPQWARLTSRQEPQRQGKGISWFQSRLLGRRTSTTR